MIATLSTLKPAEGGGVDTALQQRRLRLAGHSGIKGLLENPRTCFIAVFASLGGLVYGYNQGMFGQVLSMNSFGRASGAKGISNPTLAGLLTAILELGAWVGVLINGYSADKLGRKLSVVAACIVFCIGVIVQACTSGGTYGTILGGRFVTGLGVGSLSMVSFLVTLLHICLMKLMLKGAFVLFLIRLYHSTMLNCLLLRFVVPLSLYVSIYPFQGERI